MNTDLELWQAISKMPEHLKTEFLNYAEYLMEKKANTTHSDQNLEKKRRSGILKGTFVLPLPKDFDEPLEDFQDYME
ncbi:hypothetical protein PCC7418_1498 [Halothece sp. PCC 7418]|uniref:type II toxin-antitoxin system VapB family antitoxin n=1 Tax=Halothece sp. (strain PCC 7418) TaxID=65093 RepID=UPI0002A08A9E|nr:DUF2281 domain-containing protein [Halothece sp. PCC 7418]AFZ43687.1 hypothetical protein PCC7418_1498 [Halothece sp. PCC 7418]